jgi:nitrous oxidase accessory protein
MNSRNIFTFVFLFLLSACFEGVSIDLQKIFDEAKRNAVIVIPEGRYHGNFIINKPVTVDGKGKAVLEGDDCVLLIKADHVTVRNTSFNCKNFGIKLDHARYCDISDNIINGKSESIISKKGNGIHILYGYSNVVESNVITDVRDGIYFDYTVKNEVRKNRVINARYGYHIMYSENNILTSNSTKNSIIGTMIMTSPGSVVRNNDFSGERNVHGCGIFIYQSSNSDIEDNIVRNNTIGFSVDSVTGVLIQRNLVSGNAIGIKKVGEVSDIHFTQNDIEGNVVQIGGRAKWDKSVWSYNDVGNYWDDYKGFDFNGDGIGDGAYRINGDISSLFDRERFLGIFFGSPLCALLDGINLSDEQFDTHPLLKPPVIGR